MGGLVLGHQHGRQGRLQQVQHALQITALQARGQPLLDQVPAHGFGTQDVVRGQLAALDELHAQTQRVEGRRCGLSHGQGHAGGQDLVLHHIVAEQLELQRAALRHGGRRGFGRLQRALQGLHAGVQPGVLVLAVVAPGFTPLLHFALRAHGLGLLLHLRQQLLGHAGQALAQSSHPMQTRLLAQGGLGASRRVGRVGQGGHARECKPVQG